MITKTQTTPAGGKLQLKMNMESLQLRVELKSLLQSFGAQTSLAELAVAEFGGELLVEEAPECAFHAIRPPSPRLSGRDFHAHPATRSMVIRTGSRSAATQGWHC